jgi:phosphoribosylglycinamide formyltransferase 1
MTRSLPRIVVLASGRGSNLQALLDAIAAGDLAVELAAVLSDRTQAFALERARAAGVPADAISPREFDTRLEFDAHLFGRIDALEPDFIVCAGYMRLISEREVSARLGRILNIHPSLLPAFKGLRTHQQALDAGVAEHGASIHFVSPELDGGPVIAQAHVPVAPGRRCRAARTPRAGTRAPVAGRNDAAAGHGPGRAGRTSGAVGRSRPGDSIAPRGRRSPAASLQSHRVNRNP